MSPPNQRGAADRGSSESGNSPSPDPTAAPQQDPPETLQIITEAAFEAARARLRRRVVENIPEAPRTDEEKSEWVRKIIEAIYDARNILEDHNSAAAIAFADRNGYPRELIEIQAWELLQATIDSQGRNGVGLVPKHYKTPNALFKSFPLRMEAVISTIRSSKTACRSLMTPDFLRRLVDNPVGEYRKKELNKAGNKKKGEQIDAGKVSKGGEPRRRRVPRDPAPPRNNDNASNLDKEEGGTPSGEGKRSKRQKLDQSHTAAATSQRPNAGLRFRLIYNALGSSGGNVSATEAQSTPGGNLPPGFGIPSTTGLMHGAFTVSGQGGNNINSLNNPHGSSGPVSVRNQVSSVFFPDNHPSQRTDSHPNQRAGGHATPSSQTHRAPTPRRRAPRSRASTSAGRLTMASAPRHEFGQSMPAPFNARASTRNPSNTAACQAPSQVVEEEDEISFIDPRLFEE